jgi:uncharacterized membrane protein
MFQEENVTFARRALALPTTPARFYDVEKYEKKVIFKLFIKLMPGFETAIAVLLFLLSLVLIILGSIVSASANKTDQQSRNNVKNSGTGVLIIGVIFFIATIIPIYDLVKGVGMKSTYYF